MSGVQARSFLMVALLLAWDEPPQVALGQSEVPSIVPVNAATDQLPSRRSFAPLPINDLRSPAGNPNWESNPAPPQSTPVETPPTPVETPPTAGNSSPQEGTTSGVFLRPQAPPQAPPQILPDNRAAANPPQAGLPESGLLRPLAKSNESTASAAIGASTSSPSRPIELIPDQPIQDGQIRLASGSEPASALPGRALSGGQPVRTSSSAGDLPRQLLARYDLNRAADPLPGRPLRLEDALQSAPPERRRAIVRQYWQTYAAWANYLNQSDRCALLAGIAVEPGLQQSRLLETSRLLAEDERLQAELRLQWAQLELGRLLPSAGSELLPLPADTPLAQSYETHYQWYVANGALPPPIQVIARTLPKQLDLLQRRAATAETALSGLSGIAGRSASGGADLPTQLAALDLAEQAQQAFLQSVLDYNQWIADYSLTIAPAGQDPTAVAAMLVAPRGTTLDNAPSVLMQAANGAESDRWNERNRPAPETPNPLGPGGFNQPRQPIERVSGLEPAGAFRGSAPPVVAPAFGGQPATSFEATAAPGTGFRPPAAPPSVAPTSPAEKLQPTGSGTPPGSNSGSVGGSFAPPSSFAPPPSIPSFDTPKSPAADDQPKPLPPVGTGTDTGTGFKLGG